MGFEPTISAGKRPQTLALDRAATGDRHIYTYVHELLEHQVMQLACDGIQVTVACLLGQRACCGEGAMMGIKGDFRSQ